MACMIGSTERPASAPLRLGERNPELHTAATGPSDRECFLVFFRTVLGSLLRAPFKGDIDIGPYTGAPSSGI